MFLMTNRDDNQLSELLIGKVCSYQCLYNPANISYKSKRHKNLCWLKIGLECHLDATVAKSKWKSLRDRYVRERKAEKIAELRGTSAPRKEWALYKHLTFLDPYLATLEVGGGGMKREPPEDVDPPVGHFLDVHSYSKPPPPAPPQPYVYILPAPTAQDPPPPPPPPTPATGQTAGAKRGRLASPGDKASPLEKRFMKYVNQHGLEDAEEYSSDEMFVLSLVPSFNKLSEARKDKLKLDMHKLVYDAVYGSN